MRKKIIINFKKKKKEKLLFLKGFSKTPENKTPCWIGAYDSWTRHWNSTSQMHGLGNIAFQVQTSVLSSVKWTKNNTYHGEFMGVLNEVQSSTHYFDMINSQEDVYTDLDQMGIHIKKIKGQPYIQNHTFIFIYLTLIF